MEKAKHTYESQTISLSTIEDIMVFNAEQIISGVHCLLPIRASDAIIECYFLFYFIHWLNLFSIICCYWFCIKKCDIIIPIIILFIDARHIFSSRTFPFKRMFEQNVPHLKSARFNELMASSVKTIGTYYFDYLADHVRIWK